MADEGYRKEYPHHSRPDSQPHPQSHYPTSLPPPAVDKQQRPQAPQADMAASVTLPSIHDSRSYGPPPSSAPPRGYPSDPRYASPNAVNGYPPPGQQGHGPPSNYPLPPLQPPADHRAPAYPPPDQRGGYYDDRRAPYGQEHQPPHQQQQYPPDQYYAYRQQPPPPHPGARPGYPDQRPSYPDYRNLSSGVYEYPPSNAPQLTQAAPRQRTSIACRYCRKRKIRCSGYQSAPGGKCQNCARMNQECIFQPVSSSSSTAFIPVSAVPGGVPPGTQLFGAYGQPLAPGSVPPPPGHSAPAPYPPQHQNQIPPHYYQQHNQQVQSPTESYSSYGDPRNEDGQVAGRRRRRTSEEQDESRRLPPPRVSGEEDPRRRSPAEFSNNSSPGGLSYPYHGARQSPRNPPGSTLPQVQSTGSYTSSAPGGRSPTGQNSSSGASTPARQGQAAANSGQKGGPSVMSLSNLVDRTDIDRTMMDRLNRSREGPPNTSHGSRN